MSSPPRTPKNIFDSCHDILRNGHGIVGEKALRIITQFIFFRFIEPRIPVLFPELLKEKNTLFSDFMQAKDVDKHPQLQRLFGQVFAKFEVLRDIYTEKDIKNIDKSKTTLLLVKQIAKINVEGTHIDAVGDAYEHLLSNQLKGKFLGQFLTPSAVREMMVDIIKPGPTESVMDITCGTAGLLVSAIRHLGKDFDVNFARENYYGNEIDPDTYRLAGTNILLHTGEVFPHICRKNSFEDKTTPLNYFDIILSNPPFGLKIKYTDIVDEEKNKQFNNGAKMPIKTNSTVFLFLQLIISYLKPGGRCAIVVPQGKELFSKQSQYTNVRKYFFETCMLHQIVLLDSGAFEYTSIKTCVLVFQKRPAKINTETCGLQEVFRITKQGDDNYAEFKTLQQVVKNKYVLGDVAAEPAATSPPPTSPPPTSPPQSSLPQSSLPSDYAAFFEGLNADCREMIEQLDIVNAMIAEVGGDPAHIEHNRQHQRMLMEQIQRNQ